MRLNVNISSASPFRVFRLQQAMHRHLKGHCQLLDVIDRNIANAALHMRDKRAMQFGLKGQIFLRPTLGRPQAAEITRQYHARAFRRGVIGLCHPQDGDDMMLLRQSRLRHNSAQDSAFPQPIHSGRGGRFQEPRTRRRQSNVRSANCEGSKMSLNCPNCSNENTQLLSIAYSSGIYTGEGITRRESTSRHTHTTVTVNQSELSRQAAPPEKLSVLFPIKFGGIAALILPPLLTWLLPKGSIWEALVLCIFLGIVGLSIYTAYRSFVYNRSDWVTRMEQWQRQYLCLRCGAVFEPAVTATKNGS